MAVREAPVTVNYATRRAANGIFMVVSLIATAICAWAARQLRLEVPEAAFILSGLGLFWFSAAGMTWTSSSDPIRLVSGRFDDEGGRFLLTAADGAISALPYHELEGFDVRCKVGTGKRKGVSYVVYLLKRDGGFWDLQSFGEVAPAHEMVANLRGSVSLAAPGSQDAERACSLPDAFSREDVEGVSRFSWRSQDRLVDSLCGVLFWASFVMLLVGIVGVMPGARTFFQLVGALVVAWICRNIYRASGRTFQLEISERSLTYSTCERGDAVFQVKRVLSVDQVTRLQSTYELMRPQQERSHQLTFVAEQAAPRLQARRFERLKETATEAAALDQSIIELDLPGIRTSDVLKFEAHLQRELLRRGQAVA